MIRTAALIAITLTITACAASEDRGEPPISAVSPGVAQIAKEEGGLKDKDERVHCEYIRPTGSNRPRKVCWTREERRENQRRSTDLLQGVQNASEPIPEPAAGG